MKTSPFDMEKALSGAEVALKSGHAVSQLTMFYGIDDPDEICLVGVSSPYGKNQIFYWTKNGEFDDPEHTLVMVDKLNGMKKGEVYYSPNMANDDLYSFNIWGDGDNYDYDHRMRDRGLIYFTKEDAIKKAKEIIGIE